MPKKEATVPNKVVVPQIEEPVSSVETAAVKEKPVRDESISSMFEDTMRAIQEQTNEGSGPVEAVEAASIPTPTPQATPEPTPEPKPVQKSQSVADILGAMGMEVPGADEVESPPAATASPAPVSAPVPAPAPAAVAPQPGSTPQNVPSTPVFAKMQNASEASENTNASPGVGNAEDDIQAYMNRLLNRTGSDATTTPAAASPIVVGAQPTAAVEKEEASKPLSAEEFVPSHKPSRPENYDTLREIANTSSRTAVHQSTRRNMQEGIVLTIFCIFVVLLASGVALWMEQSLIAGLLLAIAIGSGFVFLRKGEKLELPPPRK